MRLLHFFETAVIATVALVCSPLPSSAASEGAPWLLDIAESVGLSFEYFNGMSGDYLMPEILGGGVALVDFDSDGDLDVFFVQGAGLSTAEPADPSTTSDRLFLNRLVETGKLSFEDVTKSAGLGLGGYGTGVAAGDFNRDGLTDLYVARLGSNSLLKNLGQGRFIDVTQEAGVDELGWSVPAVFFDIDNDGWLDLYVGNYVEYGVANDKECRTAAGVRDYCGPFSYEPARDRLWRNLGDGTFEDVTDGAGITKPASTLGALATDINGDGWQDLYVANDGMANHMWINQRDGSFEDTALLGGTALSRLGQPEAGMGIAIADFERDGHLDLFITHLDGESNTLYSGSELGLFSDRTHRHRLDAPSRDKTGFGVAALDVDSDGWFDLIVANGAVHVPEGAGGRRFPLEQENQLFLNRSGAGFDEAGPEAVGEALARRRVSRGLAVGDLDNDGDSDVVISNIASPAELLLNRVADGVHWLGLTLKFPDAAAMPRVEVVLEPGVVSTRHSSSGGSYGSANDVRLLFGLAKSQAESLVVRVEWKPGEVESWRLPVDNYSTLVRGQGQKVEVGPSGGAPSGAPSQK